MLRRNFPEENIFRIDHFMGKEPVQNLLYTRWAMQSTHAAQLGEGSP